MDTRYLRIHGDNILECERTLSFLLSALHVRNCRLNPRSQVFKPCYCLQADDGESFEVELLAGYDRWGIDLTGEILKQGGVLKETPDSYLTEKVNDQETILLALEYSSALPAGNNAWQRNGRGYSCAMAGIPYLYIAELGGVELDSGTRKIKAPRFPNPLVPFSYVSITRRLGVCCLPVYFRHPSISEETLKTYGSILDDGDCEQIIRGIVLHKDYSEAANRLCEKAIGLVRKRSNARTFGKDDWEQYIESRQPCEWVCQNKADMTWRNPTLLKVETTPAYRRLRSELLGLSCLTIGAKDMPICIVPPTMQSRFLSVLNECYPELDLQVDADKPLVIIWITGFKPHGDDSRPDRGLNPLTRMIVGEDAQILSIVSGPAKTFVTPESADENGLWASILKCSDYVLQDSVRLRRPILLKGREQRPEISSSPAFEFTHARLDAFTEHDIDTVVHQLFSRKERLRVFECLCNPPGGDWSGISYFDNRLTEYRWTSLPRVSGEQGKRPDHFIQVKRNGCDILLTIESKGKAASLESHIGLHLKHYINVLFDTPVTAMRKSGSEWEPCANQAISIKRFVNFSIGAFAFQPSLRLSDVLERKNLDAVIAIEFDSDDEVILHVSCVRGAEVVVKLLEKVGALTDHVIVQVD